MAQQPLSVSLGQLQENVPYKIVNIEIINTMWYGPAIRLILSTNINETLLSCKSTKLAYTIQSDDISRIKEDIEKNNNPYFFCNRQGGNIVPKSPMLDDLWSQDLPIV